MIKKAFEMTPEERLQAVDIIGDTVLMADEMQSVAFMSDKLRLPPQQVEHNIDEILYVLKKYVGKRRFLKILFMK